MNNSQSVDLHYFLSYFTFSKTGLSLTQLVNECSSSICGAVNAYVFIKMVTIIFISMYLELLLKFVMSLLLCMPNCQIAKLPTSQPYFIRKK